MSSEGEGEKWPMEVGKRSIISKIQAFAVALISDRETFTVDLLANPAGKTRSTSHYIGYSASNRAK